MLKNLHPRLRHKVLLDDEAVPDNLLEPIPDGTLDSDARAAKRRRIEIIAKQYLRGKQPVIVSAGIKGPIEDGWKNPWATTKEKGVNSSTGPKRVRRSKDVRKSSAATATGREASEWRGKDSCRVLLPEESRAVVGETQEQIDTTRANSPAALDGDDRHQGPGITGSYKTSARQYTPQNRSKASSHWLRRPQDEGRPSPHKDISPTSLRPGRPSLNDRQSHQFVSINAARGHIRSSPMKASPWESQRSTESASMIISSPIRSTRVIRRVVNPISAPKDSSTRKIQRTYNVGQTVALDDPPPSNRNTVGQLNQESVGDRNDAQCAQQIGNPNQEPNIETSGNSNMAQQITDTVAEIALPIHDDQQDSRLDTPSVGVIRQGTTEKMAQRKKSPSPTRSPDSMPQLRPITSDQQHTLQDVQESADLHPRPVSSPSKTSSKRRKSTRTSYQGTSEPTTVYRDKLASGVSTPSTEFVYRKAGGTKTKARKSQKQKPRVMDFASSPVVTKAVQGEANATQPSVTTGDQDIAQENTGSPNAADQRPPEPRIDVYDVQHLILEEEKSERRSSRPHRQSDYSTQAGLMLAHQAFQEGSFPSRSPESSRPLTAFQETPQPNFSALSPIITPFSVFNAELEKQFPDDGENEPVISTQDLFAAASPFAFSTVKKKPAQSTKSNLRFALNPSEGDSGRTDGRANTKSPTPSAERMPLKDKNSQMSVLGTVSEKGSQESGFGKSILSSKDAELSRLNFATSFDSNGTSGLTDRLLGSQEGMT